MIHKWKHFINLKALYQGNASFNKTFTLSKDTVERQRCMVKEAQAERRTWSWIPQPPGTRHVPRTHASALKGPVSAWKPLWCAVVVMRVRHPAQWPAHWYLSGRSNFTNGRLSDSKPHIFSPWHDTSLWFRYIIWLAQNTVTWYFDVAFIDVCLEKPAPSKVRVRNLGRSEDCQGQGRGKRPLLGWEAGSHRRKTALPMAWKGSEGFLNRLETKPRIPENAHAILSGWDS